MYKCNKISGRNNRGEFHADTGICTDDSCPCFRRNANGDKSTVGSDDLIYNAVEYVAQNFREKVSLEKMASICV